MRVLLANLKLFYQGRSLWLLYLFLASNLVLLGIFGFVLSPWRGIPADPEGVSVAWMSIICAVGLDLGAIVALVQVAVIAAPLSFCLPNYRTVLRELVLLVGLVLGLLVLLLELAKDSPTSLAPACLLGVSLMAYCAGASTGLRFRWGPAVAFVAVLLPLIGGFISHWVRPRAFVATMSTAVVAILLGMASAAAVWWWLGRTDLLRRRCGRPWVDLSNLWDPAAREKHRWAVMPPRRNPVLGARLDEFLLDAMTQCRTGSMAKYVWGRLYAWLLPGAGGRLYTITVGLMGLVSGALAWYMPDAGPFFIANIAVLPGAILGHSPIDSSLLAEGGRRERFWGTVTSIVVLGLLLALSVILMFVAVNLAGMPTLPESLRGGSPEPHRLLSEHDKPMNLRLVVLLLALFPLSRLLEVRLRGRGFWIKAAQASVFLPVVILAPFQRAWWMTIPVTYVALAVVLSWVLCIYGVYRIALRSDLGRR